MTLNPGKTLLNGQYRILRQLGRGGFGFVYQAQDTLLGEEVAIKELIPALVGDEAMLKRFLAEARAKGDDYTKALLEQRTKALGHELAEVVLEIADADLQDVTGPIISKLEILSLPLAPPMSREKALKLARKFPLGVGFVSYPNEYRDTNWVRMLLRYYEKGLPFPHPCFCQGAGRL